MARTIKVSFKDPAKNAAAKKTPKKDKPMPIAGRDNASRDDWNVNTKNTSAASRLSEFTYSGDCDHCKDNVWRHGQVNKLLGITGKSNG
jgi:hypothetical protein